MGRCAEKVRTLTLAVNLGGQGFHGRRFGGVPRRRGFNGVGYYFYIRKNDSTKTTREIERIGAHTKGHNLNSIGICYEGSLDYHNRPADTRTEWQIHSMHVLILTLLRDYLGCRICGHRDLSPDLNGNGEIELEEWAKACPCFEVKAEWGA